jgi:hypothetical protein
MKWRLESSLRTSMSAEELARAVIDALRTERIVELDFQDVEIMTPSFANALVMTLLDEFPIEVLRERCVMLNRRDTVRESLSHAAQRYLRGIRLSSQMPVQA